jgi:assimilatory nitrate reductase catalytic subunit
MTVHAGDRPAGLTPQEDFPTNRGGLCAKGWTAAELLDSPERLLTPLVRDRRSDPFRPASWDEALDRVVGAITRSQERYGADSVGCFGGGGLTNEKALCPGQVRSGRPALVGHRLQRPVLHVLRGGSLDPDLGA